MKRCPITYEVIPDNEQYTTRGLRLLSPKLTNLLPLPYTAAEQRAQAIARAGKMSIQGIQTKLSAQLKITEQRFDIVDANGHYILKTQSDHYPELPENEAITMSLAAMIGLDVPVHGLIYAKDNSLTYFIKRFDREGRKRKVALEDFTQLSGLSRETKYESSMEQVATIIEKFCTFPKIECVKLLKLTLFNFLVGNEDMHLKNFSLIRRNQIISLAPCYDLLNTTIPQPNTKEETALPINGLKNNLQKNIYLKYYAVERLKLNQTIITDLINEIKTAMPQWQIMIRHSFLSKKMQDKYLDLLESRWARLSDQ